MSTVAIPNSTPVSIPNHLPGVWSRQSIRWPDGEEDTSTQVWWIQANPHYADLRIPIARPNFEGILTLSECTPAHRNWMALQHGFSGALAAAETAPLKEVWQWHHEIDFRSPTGKRDVGTLTLNDLDTNLMVEQGVEEPYTEIWQRIDDGASTTGHALVLRRRNHRGHALLIAIGSHFVMTVDHRKTTSQCERIDPLNIEISHGARSGPISQWIVQHSTFPWREGRPLFGGHTAQINWRRRMLIEAEQWQIIEPTAGKLDWVY